MSVCDDLRCEKEALDAVPAAFAIRRGVLPLHFSSDGTLWIACADENDLKLQDDVSRALSCPVKAVRYTGGSLTSRLCSEYGNTGKHAGHCIKCLPGDAGAGAVMEYLISHAVNMRASDIHIAPGRKRSGVRFRIDGRLVHVCDFPSSLHRGVVAYIKNASGCDIGESRLPQDGRILRECHGRMVDFRVATLPSVSGEKLVLRVLDRAACATSLDSLGYAPEMCGEIRNLLKRREGMILCTGPTGSGKSTTLHAMLRCLDPSRLNIVTVENPVEYQVDGVTQIQVNEKAGLTFDCALRGILRSDPDVIMVGEIRDRETAALAVHAALTGHLVLSSLHAGDAASAVPRMIDIGIPEYFLAAALRAVIAQRLVRRLCPSCREPRRFPDKHCDLGGVPRGSVFYTASGCEKCHGTGCHGRMAVAEVMRVTPRISRMILDGASPRDLRIAASEEGMESMKNVCLQKVLNGETGVGELSVFYAPEEEQ